MITFDKQLYSDATLLDIKVEGMEINYAPNTLEYSLQIAKGQALPKVSILSREGQHISQNIVSPTEQHIIVTAENGNQNIYKIFRNYFSAIFCMVCNIFKMICDMCNFITLMYGILS